MDDLRATNKQQITQAKQLIYHPCYENGDFECARLELPMNYNATDSEGAKIALAVIRLPARVPVTDVRYGGPVILNPGGPGGSGVSLAVARGRAIQKIIDFETSPDHADAQSSSAKYFDVISFDPRGVMNTTPQLSCFVNSAARDAWQLEMDVEGNSGSSDIAFDHLWARAKAFSDTCSTLDVDAGGSEWIGRFMNTPPVVADMVELIERHGEWREKESTRCLDTGVKSEVQAQNTRRYKWQKGEEKLLYWGFSYGSVLGATFAALQPHRIHRLVVDGVCDSDDYYDGNWLANLQDADSALEKFFDYCHEAGPKSCPFALDSLRTTRERFYDILADLSVNPVAVPGSKTRGPDIVTYSDVRGIIIMALYSPLAKFPILAQLLTDLSHRNGSSFADLKVQTRKAVHDEGNFEALPGILCTDAKDMHGIAKHEYKKYWQTLQNQSHALGDEWSAIRMSCPHWHIRPEWPFNGSFVQNTSHPLLFIGNSYDPVTPFRNAVKMSSGFSGAGVLQQNSVGHCSLAASSECTTKLVRKYFQTGELPPPGTICEIDARPFGLPG
ncbi:TAP-like protein-domain-containing protein [Penicillium lividum]|nr:TAP-like protein-domain-containing protein [Penicillium lividum]